MGKGAGVLWQPLEEWAKQPDSLGEVPTYDPEVKKCNIIMCTSVEDDAKTIDLIIQHFSSWIRLKKCIAWLLRHKRNLREARRTHRSVSRTEDSRRNIIQPINVGEMKTAKEKY
jgi:hypothetical protein